MEQVAQRAVLLQRLALAAALLTFLLMAGWRLATPGLYYDEMLFVDAALGSPNNISTHLTFHQLPIMLMPYLGALKAWLYYPIFKLFGVSVFTVRVPVILIGVLTLWLHYRLALHAFSRSVALVFVAMAALEPATLFHTRLDWGPTTLMMLFRTLLLLNTVLWIKTSSPRYLAMAFAVMVAGAFDKLNFLWFLPALLAAVLALYPRQLVEFCRQQVYFSLGLALAAAVIAGVLLYYITHNIPLEEEIGNFDWALRLEQVKLLLLATLSGTGVYVVVTDGDPLALGVPHLLVLGVVLLLAVVLAVIYRRRVDWRMVAFFLIFHVVTLAELFITRQATGTHHMATLAPAWLLFLAIPLGQCFSPESFRKPIAIVAGVAIVAVGLSSLRVDAGNLRGFANLPKPRWDPATFELTAEIERYPGRPVIVVDWGSASIIGGLLNDKVPVLDFWPQFNDKPSQAQIEGYEAMIRRDSPLFVVPAPGAANFPDTRTNALEIVKTRHWAVQKLATFNSRNDVPLYELYTVNLPAP